MDRAKEKYKIRMNGKDNKSLYHSLTRRDIARAIKRKYFNQERYYKIHEHEMNLIITRIMELKVEQMFTTGYVDLDKDLGWIGITYDERGDEEFKNKPINWDETLNLWLDNAKAKEKKTLVRRINSTNVLKFKWSKGGIRNISYFSFTPTRSLKLKIYDYINHNKPITFLTND